MALGFARYTTAIGSKRMAMEDSTSNSRPTKENRFVEEKQGSVSDGERSVLQSLPQDILIRILCGVNHEDLRQLFHVSRSFREATLVAKQMYFAYSTPSKTLSFPASFGSKVSNEFDEIEAPNAPKQTRDFRSRLDQNKISDISVALFASPDEDRWPRRRKMIKLEV